MIRDAFVTAVIAAALAVFLLRVKEREYRTGIAMAPFADFGDGTAFFEKLKITEEKIQKYVYYGL